MKCNEETWNEIWIRGKNGILEEMAACENVDSIAIWCDRGTARGTGIDDLVKINEESSCDESDIPEEVMLANNILKQALRWFMTLKAQR